MMKILGFLFSMILVAGVLSGKLIVVLGAAVMLGLLSHARKVFAKQDSEYKIKYLQENMTRCTMSALELQDSEASGSFI